MLPPEILRWIFVVGFVLQILLGAWAIVTVTRMRRHQVITLAILNSLAARAGIQRGADRIETGAVPQASRTVEAPHEAGAGVGERRQS